MSEREQEARMERELRGVLGDRVPGPAPYGLRGRVNRIPDEVPVVRGRPALARVAPLLAAAAAVAVLVLGAVPLLSTGPATGPGATPPGSPLPAVSFDPTRVGPGVSATAAGDPGAVIALGVLLLGLTALLAPGRWRVLPIGIATILVGYAVVASQVPVAVLQTGSGPGIAVTRAPERPASDESLVYEHAAAGEPFSVGVFVRIDAPLPVTIEGIVDPTFGEATRVGFPTWKAIWLDEQADGGMTGPATPFRAFELSPPDVRAVWLVGRAGSCAYGPGFDASNPGDDLAYAIVDTVTVQVRALGWPRTVELQLPFRVAEPMATTCPG
jgi:hypothetical protein